MHGLPTESKVQKELKLKYKEDILKYGMDKFVKACEKFCTDKAKLMDTDLQRLGVWLDYKNAYYPIRNEFIEGEWWLIKQAEKQKRLYKGKKIMHWCASCETSLAKHELEYDNVKDKSVFLKFKINNTSNEYLIIWTTTPWTIPFDLGVMVNPELDYVKAKVDNEVWIVAKALVDTFIKGIAGKDFEISEEFKGEKLEGIEYIHPLTELQDTYDTLKEEFPNVHTVWLSKEYVDTESGTGLVHAAPGSGPEDYEVGQLYNVGPFNTLNEKGEFQELGKFTGLVAKKDEKEIIQLLEESGCIITTTDVDHEYPHCWRCHNPVIFRTTEQWFLKIEDLIPKMLENNRKVLWSPKTVGNSFEDWIGSLKDNSITRQRFWGAPVPIWECECSKTVVIESRKDLEKHKANIIPKDLHKPWIDEVTFPCACGKTMKRVPDVLDVWLDSGSTSWNSLGYPADKKLFDQLFPADFILEATEMTRTWFSMLTICSTIALNKNCFENVYSHGMLLDIEGVKMSKSLGNIISPYEVVDKYGADILRYYMCQTKGGQNINFNWEDIKQKQRNFIVLWNTHKFLINLSKETGIDPTTLNPTVMSKSIDKEEQYMISKVHSTIREVTTLYDEYKLDNTIGEIEELFLSLSRTYIQLVRDKSSIGNKQEKEAVVYTIYTTLLESLKMFSTISPFITEKIYQNLKEAFKLKEESIHMFTWPVSDKKLINKDLENSMDVFSTVVQAILFSREKANLGLRWPCKEVIVVTKDEKIIKGVESVSELLKTQPNIKGVDVQESIPGVKTNVKFDHAKLGPSFGSLAPKIIAKLSTESAESILKKIEDKGEYKVKIDGTECAITKEHILITRTVPAHLQEVEFRGGLVYLNKERTDELEAEGYAREVMRRIQAARKDASLEKTDTITLFLKADEELVEMLTAHIDSIKEKVGAKTVKISEMDPGKKHKHSSKEKVKEKTFELFFDVV